MKMVLAGLVRKYELLEVGTGAGAPLQERLAFKMCRLGLRMKIAMRYRG